MRLFIILFTSIMLLAACGNADDAQPVENDASTKEQEVSTSSEIANEGTEAEEPSLTEVSQIIDMMKERVASITEYAGAVQKTRADVYLEERTYSSYNLAYRATEVGQYNSDHKFKVHYTQEIEYPEENMTYEGYYYPDDVWYVKNSYSNEWYYFDLIQFKDEPNQIGFFVSPKILLDYLTPIADLGRITMHDEEQSLMEIAFELNSNTHYGLFSELFLDGYDYQTSFFKDTIYDFLDDETISLYIIVDTQHLLPLSFQYNWTMDSQEVDGTIEMSSIQNYDFMTPVEDIIIPEEAIAEATQVDETEMD